MIRKSFFQLALAYTDYQKAEEYWHEIEKKYTDSNRSYHNLSHLTDFLNELIEAKGEIQDWDTILFSMFYHDIIYDPLAQDNEEESAALATARLADIFYSPDRISKCQAEILATKKHAAGMEKDIDIFTDADLSVLGKDWQRYSNYSRQVRKEYSMYPDSVYKAGRSKVLNHFLEMKRIFKTEHFSTRYERQARVNMVRELEILNK
jgi:predicted metal-dependent HD superfamily phosphohydrolase